MSSSSVSWVDVRGRDVWKVVGREECVEEYVAGHGSRYENDWSALYVQLVPSHAAPTAAYRWSQDPPLRANLLKCTFHQDRPFPAALITASWMADGTVDGAAKAARLKKLLNLAPDRPLMQQLGHRGQMLIVLETEKEWELIIPLSFFRDGPGGSIFSAQTIVSAFRPSPKMPEVTGLRLADDVWIPYDDIDAERVFGENIPPAWLLKSIGSP